MVDIGIAAEELGWDGLFLWDHVVRPIGGEWPIADPWVVLAAVATTTTRIRLGPMVTPLSRRRITKLAAGDRHPRPPERRSAHVRRGQWW